MVNIVICAISKKLKIVEKITIQASYGTGLIDAPSLLALGKNCISLKHFEITSMKSVNSITFEPLAFKTLGTFLAIESIYVQYETSVVEDLVDTLKRSLSIRKVILWQRKKWIPANEWLNMENNIQRIAEQFPHVVIKLEKK